MTRLVPTLALAAVALIGSAATASADHHEADDGCDHGATSKPCRPDPQPTHGKDCEVHGNHGGVNEDHCLPTPTTIPTTPTEVTPSTTTTATSPPTSPPATSATTSHTTPPTTPTSSTTAAAPTAPPTSTAPSQPSTTTTRPVGKTGGSTTAPSPRRSVPSTTAAPPERLAHTGAGLGLAWFGAALLGVGLIVRRLGRKGARREH